MAARTANTLTLPEALCSLRALVIDDDQFMLDVVEETLHSFGIRQVACASSGESALRVIDDPGGKTDLLICDLQMENIDGVEILRHLADRECEAAIVVLSASEARILESVTSLASAHRLNLLGSLKKPLEIAELHALLLKFRPNAPKPEAGRRPALEALVSLSGEELEAGMRAGCAQVAFQPIFSVRNRQVVGAECLLCWRDEHRGVLAPEHVVYSAEQHGLIVPLTEIVLRQAVEALAQWSIAAPGLYASANLSSRSLSFLSLPEKLSNVVRQAGVEAHRVILEITETGIFADPASSLEVVNRLALKGFQLSIDDFGVGQSNLQKLNSMPFTELKVDKSFVQGARESPVARAIVESSVALAHNIGMQVVAEGTESQKDLEFVIKAGCDKIQGFAIAKPMPASALIPWKEIWDAGQATGYSSFLHN